MNKWIYTAISALFVMTSAFGQEYDDMYFTKADREALSAKPAAIPMGIGEHDFPNTPERQQAQHSRFSNPDGVGTGYGYQYYATEDGGVIPSSIPTTGNAYMEATQGMSIEEQQQGGNGNSGGFFSNPSVSLGMSAGTYGTGTSIGIGFGNNSAFSLGLGFGMGTMYPGYGYPMYGMGGMYPGYGYPGYGMGGMYPGYGYPGYGYGGYPGYGYGGYPGYGYDPRYGYGGYPVYLPANPARQNPRVAQRPTSQISGVKYPERYKNAMATNGVGTTRRPSSTQSRSTNNWGASRPSSDPFNNNSFRRPSNTNSSFRTTSPSSMGGGRSSGSAGRSVRRR